MKKYWKSAALVVLGIALCVGYYRANEIYQGYKMCQTKDVGDTRLMSYLDDMKAEIVEATAPKAEPKKTKEKHRR